MDNEQKSNAELPTVKSTIFEIEDNMIEETLDEIEKLKIIKELASPPKEMPVSAQRPNSQRSLGLSFDTEIEEENTSIATKARVLLVASCPDRKFDMGFVVSLLGAKENLAKEGIDISWCFIANKMPDHINKNIGIANFLASKDFTHLLFVGVDFSFSHIAILRLVEANEDLICAPCPMASHQWKQVTEYSTKNNLTLDKLPALLTNYVIKATGAKMRKDLMSVVFASSDFMMLSRSCVELMVKKYAHTKYIDETGLFLSPVVANNLYALFDIEYVPIDSTGKITRLVTADEVFCRRWKECGELKPTNVMVDTKACVSRMTVESIVGCMDRLAELLSVKTEK